MPLINLIPSACFRTWEKRRVCFKGPFLKRWIGDEVGDLYQFVARTTPANDITRKLWKSFYVTISKLKNMRIEDFREYRRPNWEKLCSKPFYQCCLSYEKRECIRSLFRELFLLTWFSASISHTKAWFLNAYWGKFGSNELKMVE